MNRERLTVFALAALFYVAGGWSLYGEHEHAGRSPEETGEWKSTDAMISAAYQQDAEDHDLTLSTKFLGYKYLAEYKPEDPAVAILDDDPHYAFGLGLIGFGTLIELVVRRRGKFRGHVGYLSVTE